MKTLILSCLLAGTAVAGAQSNAPALITNRPAVYMNPMFLRPEWREFLVTTNYIGSLTKNREVMGEQIRSIRNTEGRKQELRRAASGKSSLPPGAFIGARGDLVLPPLQAQQVKQLETQIRDSDKKLAALQLREMELREQLGPMSSPATPPRPKKYKRP